MFTCEPLTEQLGIQVLPLAESNEWAEFVLAHPERSPYHDIAWLNSVNQAYNFDVLPVVARDKNNVIVGVLPLVRLGWPLNKLCSLPYCDVGGPLTCNDNVKTIMLEWVKTNAKTQQVKSLEVRQKATVADPLQSHKVRMLLPLPNSSEELLASFKSKLRSQINKSMRNGLKAVIGNDSFQVSNFYDVYARNMRDLGSPPHSIKWFEQLSNNYGTNAVIATIWHNDLCIGAGFVLRSGQKWSIPWASTIQDYNSLAPNMLLYWELLSFCCNNGGGEFDFGRSTPGEGTFKFKAQWGAQPEALDWQTLSDANQWLMVDSFTFDKQSNPSSIREALTKVWSRLPVSVSTFFGARLRKFITL